jgi:hypothetical protein
MNGCCASSHARATCAGAGRQHLVLGVAGPQQVLALHGRHGEHGVRAADRRGARLGQAEVFHLALRDQFADRPRHVLDGDARVDAVLVEQVDRLDAEAGQ